MPEELERRLQLEAAEKFPDDPERQRAYVYGTLRKTGWTPKKHEMGEWQPPWEKAPHVKTPRKRVYQTKYTPEELRARIKPERKKPARFKD